MAEGGAFLRFAYDLDRRRATGLLHAELGSRAIEVALRDGGAVFAELDVLGRRTEETLATIAATPDAHVWFTEGRATPEGRSLALSRWVRRHLERQLTVDVAEETRRALEARELVLDPARVPALDSLDASERRILESLRRRPDFVGLLAAARTPRFQLVAFLVFLRTVGALASHARLGLRARGPGLSPEASPSAAWQVLGLAPGSDLQRVKSEFKRLARAMHPDLHTSLASAERRELERKLSRLTAAYASVVAGF